MIIRQYTTDDFEQLAHIYNAAHPDEFYGEDGHFSYVKWEDDKYIMSVLSDSEVYVCEGASILGFCGYYKNHINWLFVDPACRGEGVASKLLSYVIPQLEDGATLSVWQSNKRAKALYERFGFQIQKEFMVNFQGKDMWVNRMVIKKS